MKIPKPSEDHITVPSDSADAMFDALAKRARQRIGQIKRELERDLHGRDAPDAVERRELLDKLTLWAQILGEIKGYQESTSSIMEVFDEAK